MYDYMHGSPEHYQHPPESTYYVPKWVFKYLRAPADMTATRLEAMNFYVSPRLQANPAAHLEQLREVREFRGRWDSGRRTIAEDILTEATTINPRLPTASLKIFSAIPVDMRNDAGAIKRYLECLQSQDLPRDEWIAIFLLNERTDIAAASDPAAVLNAFQMVTEAADTGLPVSVAYTHYQQPITIGEIRSHIWDAMLTYIDAHNIEHDIVGVSSDVDIINMSTNYLRTFCEQARLHPEADAFTTNLLWQPIGPYGSDANKILQYWQFLEAAARLRTGFPGAADANTAFRASTYAGTGGYKPYSAAETIAVRNFIEAARKPLALSALQRENVVLHCAGAHLRTHSRRIVAALNQNIAPHNSWSALPFTTGVDTVRSSSPVLTNNELAMEEILSAMDMFYFTECENADKDGGRSERTARQARKLLGISLE